MAHHFLFGFSLRWSKRITVQYGTEVFALAWGWYTPFEKILIGYPRKRFDNHGSLGHRVKNYATTDSAFQSRILTSSNLTFGHGLVCH